MFSNAILLYIYTETKWQEAGQLIFIFAYNFVHNIFFPSWHLTTIALFCKTSIHLVWTTLPYFLTASFAVYF